MDFNNLVFVSAQPDVPYFHWQIKVYVHNFIEKGINPNDIHIFNAGFDEYKYEFKNGIHYHFLNHNSYEYSPLIEIVDKQLESEYWFLVHDTCKFGPNFKQVLYINLKQQDGKAVLINSGLGHGFISKSDNTIVSYLLSSKYNPSEEYEINPFDNELNINWNFSLIEKSKYVISAKDSSAPSLNERLISKKLPI